MFSYRESIVRSLIMMFLVAIIVAVVDMTPKTDLKVDVGLFESISREQIVKAIKKNQEYIDQEKEKDDKINQIIKNSYFEKLKKSNILRENKTIDPLKRFDIIKFVKDGNTVSETVKGMSTKELISNFSVMNDEDKISTILTIISRNEFKDDYINQLEAANTSISKEENKTKEAIEKIEKPFNEKFNQTVEKQLQIAKQIRRSNVIVVALLLVFIGCTIYFLLY